ncbi:hypothetical protein [Paraliomyxa miuraensis]|uniref:hypothetical protein n=1 Tax=Paraliomyxa miuraensis TaxID=376150 RepID=UPI00225070C9|nr:hypothetical protein [Paraliomyxa miuraensis]MCX4239912.1 hypothetical protein [Paraliomyxa miuraensis]
MRRSHRPWTITALFFLLACDSADQPKAPDAKSADAKAPDAKAPDAKTADAKAADAKAPDTKPSEVHFDASKDKSGALARSAAVIEIARAHDDESLRELSHHAESMPSFEDVCKHEAEVGKSGVSVPDCIKAMEHHLVKIGPELYGEVARCIMAAKTAQEVALCDAAELEVEKALHDAPHGEGLTKEVCTGLFTQFEKLAMDDAGDHAALVEEVLEEVEDDVIASCQEQGTQAEIDCAMKAKTMAELKDCASTLL